MTLPILDKTWNLDLNVLQPNSGNGLLDRQKAMFLIKEKLKNMPVPWTVIGSSNGITTGMDAVDRWTVATDILFTGAGATGQSWIVLQQSAINAKFQLLIMTSSFNTTGSQARIAVSPVNGFGAVNGGSNGGLGASNPPTATDQTLILSGSNTPWLTGATSVALVDLRFDFWQSSDGQVNRFEVRNLTANNSCLSFCAEKPKDPVTGWTNPCIYSWAVTAVANHTYANWNDSDSRMFGKSPVPADMPLFLTCEGAVSGMLGQNVPGANSFSGGFDIFPMGLAGDGAGQVGRHGARYDIWWVPTGLLNGSTMPLTPAPTREFAVFDNKLMVWDGTLPVLV